MAPSVRTPAAEGAFASFNPRFQATGGHVQAEPNGLVLGRFGWLDHFTGLAYSARQAPTDQLGFVIPVPIQVQGVCMDWRYKYWDVTRKAFVLRGGMEATLVTRADVWARFPGGSYVTQQVYANVLDGSCLAVDRNTGPVDGYELTPFSVVSTCGPGELSVISSWSFFTP